MVRCLILAIMSSIVSMSCAMNNANIPQMNQSIPNMGNYVDTQAIKNGHRGYVYNILYKNPQEATRLESLKTQIERMSIIAQPGQRYGNAVRVSAYLPFIVAGGFAHDLGLEYDGIIASIGLDHHLM